MSSRKTIVTILLCTTLCMFTGCGKKETVKETEKVSTAVNVTVEEVMVEGVEDTVTYTGEIKAIETAGVSAKTSGIAKVVYKKVGDYVKAGEALAKIDDTDYLAQYDQAVVGLSQASAAHNQANAAYSQASAACEQANAAYEQAVSNYDQAVVAHEQAKIAYKQAEAAVGQAEAAYNQANAAYQGALSSYNSVANGSAEQTKLQLEANVNAAKIEYDNAKINHDNQKALYENGAISKSNYDAAVTRLDNATLNYETAKKNYALAVDVVLAENKENAQSGVNSAKEAVNSAQAAVTSAKTGVESAQAGIDNAAVNVERALSGIDSANAGVNSAKAGLESANSGIQTAEASISNAEIMVRTAKNALDNTVVRAPISGYVSARNTNKGQMISPGVDIFTIKATNSVVASVNVTESVVANVSVGTKAIVNVKSAGLKNIEGVVSTVNPVKDLQTGMYTVEVEINNSKGMLSDGMFAEVTLTLKDSVNAVVVSGDAVMEDENGEKYVYVADGDKAEKVNVQVGIVTDEKTEIISGLESGDKVIITGKEYISEKNNLINIVK